MFETTVVESRRRKRGLRGRVLFIGSIVGHGVAALVILVSAVFFDPFPTDPPRVISAYHLLVRPKLDPPPPPKGNPTPRTNRPRRITKPDEPPAIVPTSIPDVPPERPPDVPFDPTAPDGVEGGSPDGVDGGVAGGVGSAPVRKKNQPVVVEKDAPLPIPSLVKTPPRYPGSLERKGVHGSVQVRYVIGKDGKVSHIEVVQTSHELFTRATLEAMKTWQFQPLEIDGEKVEVIHEVTVFFVLNRRYSSS